MFEVVFPLCIALVSSIGLCVYTFYKLGNKCIKLQEKYSKLLSQKISSEVRLGKIGENMAPFLNDWPYDPNKFRFLGNPVDGIQFTDDSIIFVEIKTGRSRLSKNQKQLRQLVLGGNIYFATFRINEDGCDLNLEKAEIKEDK